MSTPTGDRLRNGTYSAFGDEVADRMFALFSAQLTELWTVRDRLRLVEAALAHHGVPVGEFIEAFRDTPEGLAAMSTDRDAFITRTLEPLTKH